eukprot:5552592-Prymnesium_polylepis.1
MAGAHRRGGARPGRWHAGGGDGVREAVQYGAAAQDGEERRREGTAACLPPHHSEVLHEGRAKGTDLMQAARARRARAWARVGILYSVRGVIENVLDEAGR